jgi:quercetin dioxygenase-like cupin family protein
VNNGAVDNIMSVEREEMRGKIVQLEAAMKAAPEHHVEIPLRHYFAPGLYLREITIPKGTTLTGKIHKTEHLCILSKGKVSVWTDEGMKTLEASHVVHSLPGIKRVLYAHEESVWINVHHNPMNEQDPEVIEDIYVCETYDAFLNHAELKQIEGEK